MIASKVKESGREIVIVIGDGRCKRGREIVIVIGGGRYSRGSDC